MLTPVAKSWPSQYCLAANELAIQIHGGYGYTRDFPVEQFYRDNRLNPIHEGTNGIQGLDLLGRRIVANDGLGMTVLQRLVVEDCNAAEQDRPELAGYSQRLLAAFGRLEEVTDLLSSSADRAVGLANSSVYLNAFGTCVVGWMWLSQLLEVSRATSDDYYLGKSLAGRYFFRFELPKVTAMFDLLESLDDTTLQLNPDWL